MSKKRGYAIIKGTKILNSYLSDIKKIFKDATISVIKEYTGKNRDRYLYEINLADEAHTVIKIDPEENPPRDRMPDLEDTWAGFKACGLDFDLNIYDNSQYGGSDEPGLSCDIYPVNKGHVNTEEGYPIPVKCYYRDSKGKLTEFRCANAERYLELFAEWGGKDVYHTDDATYTVTATVTLLRQITVKAPSKKEALALATDNISSHIDEHIVPQGYAFSKVNLTASRS